MSRLFVIIPAAGRSRRMGRPKLLLPWGLNTVIGRTLQCFEHPQVAERLVVVRRDDVELAAAAVASGAAIHQPAIDPPEMRDSVERGLEDIARRFDPTVADGWILSPADHPLLEPQVLEQLLAHWLPGSPEILIPTSQGRRGHPVIFPWSLAQLVHDLPPDSGLNRLVRSQTAQTREIPVTSASILLDLDTPEDYERHRPRVGLGGA